MFELPEQLRVNQKGHLEIGGCDTVELTGEYGTPLFVYDELYIRKQIQSMHQAFSDAGISEYEIAYASKAFCTVAMCQLVVEEGCSLDVVSGGELYTALSAGVPPAKIHMHGNNKTRLELEFGVREGIGLFVVDNDYELELLNDVAAQYAVTVDVILRVSPGVEAHTHEFISTGQQDSKFGFDYENGAAKLALERLVDYPRLRCVGVHGHIGSQIFDARGFTTNVDRLAELYKYGEKLGLPMRIMNVGGGFGIRYTSEDDPIAFTEHFKTIHDALVRSFGSDIPEVWIEPGRSIAGPAGITLYTVGSQKVVKGVRQYVSIDGGMTDNPRLALYGAKYEVLLANRVHDQVEGAWSVAGKCCESGDMIVWDAPLPTPTPGDLLAVLATGAYNYSMASHYNRIPNPAVIFVRDGESQVVVERERWDDVVRNDRPLKPVKSKI